MSGKGDSSALGFGGREMTSLHDVVLDYLESHAYASTARVLVQPSTYHNFASSNGLTSSAEAEGLAVEDDQMDIDSGAGNGAGSKSNDAKAWNEERLLSIDRRRDIINMILNGAIMRAVESLNTHFAAVLNDTSSAILDSKGKSAVSSNGASMSSSFSRGRPGHLSYSSYSASDATNGSSNAHAQLADGVRRASGSTWTFGSSLNGQSSNGNSNGNGNGHTGSWRNGHMNGSSVSDDHALPVMHLSLHPAHVKLNLSIQAFIESFRQLAPSSSPSTPSSSIGDLSNSINMSMSQSISNAGGGVSGTNGSGFGAGPSASALKHSNGVTLTNALTAAQGLHAEAKKLEPEDRAVYLQEIKDVGALLAYTDPETSILKGFLEQGRRIALAEQVNRAILVSEGHLPFSQLELYARRTTALWTLMAEKHVDNVPNWTAADGLGKEQLSALVKRQTKPGRGFSLRDYVADSLI